MKTKSVCYQIITLLLIFFLFAPAPAAGEKILMIIQGQSGANTESLPPMIVGKLIGMNYQAVTLDDLSPSSQLTAGDILEAKKGNIPTAQKAAADCGADLILMASVKSQISPQELYGVKMNKAVATVSYKLIDAVSGSVVTTDSTQYRGAGTTPEEAEHASFIKASDALAQIAAEKMPAAAAASPRREVAAKIIRQPALSAAPDISDAPPEIIISNPPPSRGVTRALTRGITRSFTRGITRGVTRDIGENRFTIKGEVKDKTGIRSVKINEQSVTLDSGGSFSHDVALSAGENTFLVTAVNTAGKASEHEVVITKPATALVPGMKPVLWGLAVGVSRYQNAALNLEYADKDALSLAQSIEKQQGKLFSEVHFKTLVNENVTRDNILQQITAHLGKAAPDDVVFIFIAGHGIKHERSGSYYFVPYDADADSILSKGLRMSDFEESVKILSKDVNKVVIAMDTCHSGAMNVGSRALEGGENLAEALKAASGLFILAASKGGESSLEDEKFKMNDKDSGHGAFTFALIEGMSGKANYDGDAYISLNELFQYVAKQVPRMTEGKQHPYFRADGTDMPFILLKE